jgi:outer membrane protein assembly factor BamA
VWAINHDASSIRHCAKHNNRDDVGVRLPAVAVFICVIALLCVAGIAQNTTAKPQNPDSFRQNPFQHYDPFRGMDGTGRIPKPQFPGDLERPERWRYTPPARIKPGGVLDRFWVSSFVTPIIFREEDIGFGGGLAMTDIDFRNQNFQEFANIVATYSAEGQQNFRINWSKWLNHRTLANGGIIREERGRVYARGGYSKTLTRRFFGFGSRSVGGDETTYTEELTDIGFGMRVPLPDSGSDWLARVDVELQHHALSSGRVSTLPSTDLYKPQFMRAFQDGDGVDQIWVTGRFGWDTRDSLAQAYRGQRLGVSIANAFQSAGKWGSIIALDGQQVIPLPPLFHQGAVGREENPPTDVFALGFFVQDTIGELPFYSLPTLGGSRTLRGYIQNRYTDRAAAHFSAEYRINLVERGYAFTDTIRIERIGIALFYDAGTVAADVDRLDNGRFLDSYGIGLRLAFSREAVFRADVGYSEEGSNLTIAFGNAF